MAWNTNLRWRLPVICLLLQVALVVLFGVFVRYDLDADPHWIEKKMSGNVSSDLDNEFYYRYPSNLINADFCVGSVCVAFGAVLGKVSPVQLLIMTLFQVTLFSVNEFILLSLLEVKDAGGSMTIHTFGAYFGLTVTWILYRPNLYQSKDRQSPVYHSDLFAMIGESFHND
ncbi:hypothetical protein E2I00_007799 [Balaenoptera physalus]|uniref:Ammonium transporter AmtB-like domain-containing protein n=1 Tax=Balaenoptera physalus TaxID=9770 RepID=A0A643C9K6_BALPH|nr:hypothetical protein E2I00_007799 [Balaenoptera physalus]